jgi:hypothetical protein
LRREAAKRSLRAVDEDSDLAPVKLRNWTRVDDYFEALARRRTARRSRRPAPRTQPEAPHFLLSTLPFLALFAGLAVLVVGIAISAWPGGQPQPEFRAAQPERGVAPKGWFQEAEKEMRRKG